MTGELQPGESIDLETVSGGGPVVTRDSLEPDEFAIEGNRGVLTRREIERIAQLAGVVTENGAGD